MSRVPQRPVERYSYQPLKTKSSMRVLQVDASTVPNSQLICRLTEARLEAHPPYAAISYTWEGQTPTDEIQVDGRPLLITKNANNALRYFRDDENSKFFWIDSVCINQSKAAVDERSQQVRLMGRIYADAETVLVWLMHSRANDSRRHNGLMMWNLGELVQAANLLHSDLSHQDPGVRERAALTHVHRHRDVRRKIVKICNDLYDDCAEEFFDETPWFTRLWTIQEVALARRGWFIWDGVSIDFHELFRALHRLTNMQPPLGQHDENGKFASAAFGKVRAAFTPYQMAFQNDMKDHWPVLMFQCTDHMRCSMPHDKVYSLYGLLSQGSEPRNLAPDYCKPPDQVYLDYTRYLLKLPEGGYVLENLTGLRRRQKMKSWAPDLSLNVDTATKIDGVEKWTARKRHGPRDILLSADEQQLLVKGVTNGFIRSRADCSIAAVQNRTVSWSGSSDFAANQRPSDPLLGKFGPHLHEDDLSALLLVWNVKVLQHFVDFTNATTSADGRHKPEDEFLDVVWYEDTAVELEDHPLVQAFSRLYHCLQGERTQPKPELERMFESNSWQRTYNFHLLEQSQFPTMEGLQRVLHLIDHISDAHHLVDVADSPEFQFLRSISPQRHLVASFENTCERLKYQTLFRTDTGKLGVAPWSIREGDQIFMWQGSDGPAAIRRVGEYHEWVTRIWFREMENCDVPAEAVSRMKHYTFV